MQVTFSFFISYSRKKKETKKKCNPSIKAFFQNSTRSDQSRLLVNKQIKTKQKEEDKEDKDCEEKLRKPKREEIT